MIELLQKILDRGLAVIVNVEPDVEGIPDPGPVRIVVHKFPWMAGRVVMTASGTTVEEAYEELKTATDEMFDRIGSFEDPPPVNEANS